MSYPTCSGISCSADCADRDPRLRKDDVKSKSKDDNTKAQSGLLSICAADAPQFSSAVYNKSAQARKLQAGAAQSGRSMIEMLGVLAIIGVLSVGGIAGYSKAMMQYKINKTADQITQIVGNVRTLYAGQKNYNGVNQQNVWKKAHLFPDEMWSDGYSYPYVENPFGGGVELYEGGKKDYYDNKAFSIFIHDLPEEACMALATYDWGSGSSSGLIAVAVNTGSPGNFNVYDGFCGSSSPAIAAPNGARLSVPMPVNIAASACYEGDNNMIGLKFY